MKEAMYCVCGFSAHSGNKLAKHLGTHGCQSAYASLEEAERARNIPAGQEENFFIYSRDTGALQEKGEEKDEEQREDEDNVKNDTVEKEVVEKENIETDAEGEDKKESSEEKKTDEVENEGDKQPGPGGLLFGTLFKYMEEGEGEDVPVETSLAPERENSEVKTDENQTETNDIFYQE